MFFDSIIHNHAILGFLVLLSCSPVRGMSVKEREFVCIQGIKNGYLEAQFAAPIEAASNVAAVGVGVALGAATGPV